MGPTSAADTTVREAIGPTLVALEEDLKNTSTWIMGVLLVLLFVVPLTIMIGIWIAGEILIGLILGVLSALFLLLLVGLEVERAVDRRFKRYTKARLQELADENGLTASELVALVAEIVPEQSKLRKRITKENRRTSELAN